LETTIVGDRMDTDIIAGIHSEIDTVLVLSGVTAKVDLKKFAYHPRYILPAVGDIPDKFFEFIPHSDRE
jgi:NagD protein